MDYYWNTQGGIYSTKDRAFIESVDEDDRITDLYMDVSDPNNLVLADNVYIRKQLLFYGLPLGEVLMNKLDKIQAIQAQYIPQLDSLKAAKAAADMDQDTEEAEAIRQEFLALRDEMHTKINEVPDDTQM